MGEGAEAEAPIPERGLVAVDDDIDLTDRSGAKASPLTARCTPDGAYLYVSWFARSVLDLERSEMVGRSLFDFVHPADVPRMRQVLREAGARLTHVTTVYRHRTGTGGYLWLESVLVANRDPARNVRYLFISSRDVSGRVLLQQELNQVQEVLRIAVTHSPEGLGVTDGGGRWTMVNPVLARLTGYSRDELQGLRLCELVHPDDRPAHDRALERAAMVPGAVADLDERFVTRDGDPIWLRVVVALVRDDDGNPTRMVVQVSDLQRFRARELDLERQALVDPLTGIGNRRLLFERLRAALADRRAHGGPVAVVMVDVDDFKDVNDRLGHDAGDRVVCTVAERLAGTVREHDTVARLGGDEFVVVGTGLRDPAEAEALGARLREALEAPVTVGAHRLAVTASIGVVMSRPGESAESVLRRADREMYGVKARKPGR